MALNPQYVEIGKLSIVNFAIFNISIFGIISYNLISQKISGKGFVAQYYALFDDPNQRNSLVNMYNVSISNDCDYLVEKRKIGKFWKLKERTKVLQMISKPNN